MKELKTYGIVQGEDGCFIEYPFESIQLYFIDFFFDFIYFHFKMKLFSKLLR